MDVLIFTGSSGKNSQLAATFEKTLTDKGLSSRTVNLEDLKLPLYLSSASDANLLPDDFSFLKDEMKQVKKMVFIAPEYNGNVPPSFNNFLAWCSVSSDDWREFFNGKKCAIATHSGGGGAHVLMHMRMQLSFVGMNVIGREILTNYKKPVNPESLEAVIDQLVS
jgi:NAD(P)H-dependent FMN reductase